MFTLFVSWNLILTITALRTFMSSTVFISSYISIQHDFALRATNGYPISSATTFLIKNSYLESDKVTSISQMNRYVVGPNDGRKGAGQGAKATRFDAALSRSIFILSQICMCYLRIAIYVHRAFAIYR